MNGLPSTNTYIYNFGSWTNAQFLAGVEPKKIKKSAKEYNKDYLIKVAKENISYFKHTNKWELFTKKNNLPDQYVYIRAFGTMANAKKEIGITDPPTRKNYTSEELVQIALNHISYFTTQSVWDSFAKENNLPRYRAFANAFGSWRESKEVIHQFYGNRSVD